MRVDVCVLVEMCVRMGVYVHSGWVHTRFTGFVPAAASGESRAPERKPQLH